MPFARTAARPRKAAATAGSCLQRTGSASALSVSELQWLYSPFGAVRRARSGHCCWPNRLIGARLRFEVAIVGLLPRWASNWPACIPTPVKLGESRRIVANETEADQHASFGLFHWHGFISGEGASQSCLLMLGCAEAVMRNAMSTHCPEAAQD